MFNKSECTTPTYMTIPDFSTSKTLKLDSFLKFLFFQKVNFLYRYVSIEIVGNLCFHLLAVAKNSLTFVFPLCLHRIETNRRQKKTFELTLVLGDVKF